MDPVPLLDRQPAARLRARARRAARARLPQHHRREVLLAVGAARRDAHARRPAAARGGGAATCGSRSPTPRSTSASCVRARLPAHRGRAHPHRLRRLRRRARRGTARRGAATAPTRGGTDWLAVGRIAPNKCQHDVVLAFAAYRRLHDPLARLTLVGGQSAGQYWRALHRLTDDLGIADAVTFTDVVSHAELLACYRTSDLSCCASRSTRASTFPCSRRCTSTSRGRLRRRRRPRHRRRRRPRCSPTRTRSSWRPRSTAYARTHRCAEQLVDAGRTRVEHFSIARTGPQLLESLHDAHEGIADDRRMPNASTGASVATAGRLAFVPPRYGTDIVGGSEAVMREAAHGLARRGWDVEVLTTCARDHYTWRTSIRRARPPTATSSCSRFPVEGSKPKRSRSASRRASSRARPVSLADQLAWLDGLFRVPGALPPARRRTPTVTTR